MIFGIDPDVAADKARLAVLGVVGAILSLMVEPPPTISGKLMAVISGPVVAAIATPPTAEFLNLSPSAAAAVAGAYGIGALGLVKWVQMAMRDPPGALRALVGLGARRDAPPNDGGKT